MTINQQSEKMNYSNQLEFRTPAQKEKWNELADIHKELSSMDIETTNPKIAFAMNNLNKMLNRLSYLVDPKQKYNVVFLGGSGEGKSTILNVLIGRNLLPAGKQIAITSTILNIQAIEDNEPEKVVIDYYNDTTELIEQINGLISQVDINQHESLMTFKYIFNTNEDKRAKYQKEYAPLLRKIWNGVVPNEKDYVATICNIMDSYTLHYKDFENQKLPHEYLIPQELEKLHDLIKNGNEIFLISHITCKIDPSKSSNEDMAQLLKENVCLVDVPGFGSTNPLHEIVTKSYIKDKEPLFIFVIANNPRISDKTSLNTLDWVYYNYIEKTRENKEMLHAVSECIFMVVNNKLNQINEEEINDLDMEIRKQISKYTSQYYLHQFKDNGEGPKPYILVTPLPVACINKQYQNSNEERHFNFCCENFAKSLGLISDTDKFDINKLSIEARKIILNETKIPLLIEEVLSFLKNKRVNLQINRAYESFNSWLKALDNLISSLLENYDYFSREDRAKRILEEKKVDFQNQLDSIHNQFFENLGKDDESITSFITVFNSSLDKAKIGIKAISEDFKGKKQYEIIIDYINGQEAIQTKLAELGNDINIAIQRNLCIYAEDFANELLVYFDSILDDKGIKSKMVEITYGNEYAHERVASRLNNCTINGIEKTYEFHINSFKKDCIETFRTLIISELLCENKCSAFSQLTMNNISGNDKEKVSNKINNQIDIVLDNVTEILNESSDNALFKKLRRHFFYHYYSLKKNFELEYNIICDLHIITLSNNPNLVNAILKTDSKHENELYQLFTVLSKVKQLREKLSAISSTENNLNNFL
jgi:GTP-binding protein EngB required for normal cell division